jgi:hypothetical protein
LGGLRPTVTLHPHRISAFPERMPDGLFERVGTGIYKLRPQR